MSSVASLSDFMILKRHQNRLRQQDLARQLGVTASYLSSIESGRRVPKSTIFWQNLIAALKLGDDDQHLLHQMLRASNPNLTIPPDLLPEVRELLYDLAEFGNQLRSDQLAIIKLAVRPRAQP